MPGIVTVLAVVFAALGLLSLVAAAGAMRRRRLFRLTTRLTFSVMWLALAASFGILVVGTQGYRALTHEQVAAIVETQPLGEQRFRARFRFPDGRIATYTLSGDELYVDAHILKWKPIANFLGLHTAYELDRVAGRYRELADEQKAPRTVHGIGEDRPIDMFNLRQRYTALAPLLDTEYGSATFVPADQPARLEVRVSTSGLLMRRIDGRGE